MISSGAFPKLALEKAADAGPVVVPRLLRRLADQPRDRNQRERGEHERHACADGCKAVENDDSRGRREECQPGERGNGLALIVPRSLR